MVHSFILLDSLAHATFLACIITAAIVYVFINKVTACQNPSSQGKPK